MSNLIKLIYKLTVLFKCCSKKESDEIMEDIDEIMEDINELSDIFEEDLENEKNVIPGDKFTPQN